MAKGKGGGLPNQTPGKGAGINIVPLKGAQGMGSTSSKGNSGKKGGKPMKRG